MPSILSRFKRSPSTSSSISESDLAPPGSSSNNANLDPATNSNTSRSRRSSTVSSSTQASPRVSYIDTDRERRQSLGPGSSGSVFVEDFESTTSSSSILKSSLSPSKRHVTPSPRQKSPPPLSVPGSEVKTQPLGTPKLVLTEEGSNSPRSFSSSPLKNGRPGIGLGLGSISVNSSSDDDLETPTQYDTSFSINRAATATMNLNHTTGDDVSRDRASSIISSTGGRSRAGSTIHSKGDAISPPLSPHALKPVDSRMSSASKKSRKSRRRSVASGHSGIAAALAKGGLHIAGPVSDDLLKSVSGKKHRSTSQKRSPFLTRNKDTADDDEINLNGNEYGDEDFDADDFDDEDDSDSDLGDDLPVTGFAVASNRRNADFHALFPTIDDGDYLIEDYGCALSKDILVQGRLYVSENHICFHANIFGWVTDVVVAFADVKTIEKKMTALVIPNAIGVVTPNAKYTFASLINRDSTYDVMMNIWRLCNPNAVMSSVSLGQGTNLGSRPGSVAGDDVGMAPGTASSSKKGHAPTQCACGKEGKHYSETALETTFPSTPEKIYNLMFNSGWFKTFLSDSQKLKDIEQSDWRPVSEGSSLLTRSISYIKPLNGSIGPKQTKCHIVDEHEHMDFDNYVSMITTTRTPDVPSGGVFSVKTRTCFMWAGSNSTKVVVTTTVEWTGKSWVKGIIEKSAIDGQKTYHDDLESGMRQYIKENAGEFAGEGGEDEDEVAAAAEGGEAGGDGKKGGADSTQSEAQAYADSSRKKRQDEDMSLLQAGLDSLSSGAKAIFSGIGGIFESVSDLLADTPFKTQNLMGLVIVILIISNIWTYTSIDRQASIERRERRMGTGSGRDRGDDGLREGYADDEFARAVRRVLASRSADPRKEEGRELMRILDEVEARLSSLREGVAAVQKSERQVASTEEGAGSVGFD
ncbi:hypothetical protein I317_05460 [Kwoniella heveanensis CBS 569]|nr:hypothetical protein I317_05460 [Kwoniella heveanensis CBS 569]